MLKHKITPPAVADGVTRRCLVERALAAPVSVLTAPAGHGKTDLAARLVVAGGGPVVWFVADELDRDASGVVTQLLVALGAAWPDLAGVGPVAPDDRAALAMLAATLETLAGPGCIVIDDAHALDDAVLDALVGTVLRALAPTCRLVVCTRAGPPPALLRAIAAGQARVLGAADLAFTPGECAELCRAAGREPGDLHARTGGWPLAAALAIRAGGLVADHVGSLADLALADVSPSTRALLTVLARLPHFPVEPVTDLVRAGPLPAHPGLIEDRAGGNRSLRPWLRDALAVRPAEPDLVSDVACWLDDGGHRELAAHLLLTERRYDAAVPRIEDLAQQGARQGRWGQVAALTAAVPAGARSFEIELLALTAAQGVNRLNDESALTDLVAAACAVGPGATLRAQYVLAAFRRMGGDVRFVAVCEEALGDALHAPDPEAALARTAPARSADEVVATAELLRYYGHALLLAEDRSLVERGRRLVAAAVRMTRRAGRDAVSQDAWRLYAEALLYLREPGDVVPRLRAAVRALDDGGHSDAALRVAELAVIEYLAGDYAAARRAVEQGRECAHRVGTTVTLLPLAAVGIAVDMVEGEPSAHIARLDEVLAEMWTEPRSRRHIPAFATAIGCVLVHEGATEAARRCLRHAWEPTGDEAHTSLPALQSRRLRGLLELAEGLAVEGRATLDALRADAAGQGRTALVTLIDADLDPAPGTGAPVTPAAAVRVEVLGAQLGVTVAGEPGPLLRGYPAKLLALLVARRGVMTVDAAIEGLWPGADPDVGRNRLHGILLRLRRSLGLPADGPIVCADGLVRLDRNGAVSVDAWEYEQAAVAGPATVVRAVGLYKGDVLAEQFAYDGAIDDYRDDLRMTFLRLATTVLSDAPPGVGPAWVADVARRATRSAPDDQALSLTAARALARAGWSFQARALVATTAGVLAELGIDPAPFERVADDALAEGVDHAVTSP